MSQKELQGHMTAVVCRETLLSVQGNMNPHILLNDDTTPHPEKGGFQRDFIVENIWEHVHLTVIILPQNTHPRSDS